MPLRHDDELPPLTPAQQADAIRLAARLQAEHEANSTASLVRAAEEAGIERRFLDEAVSRVATRPRRRLHRTEASTSLRPDLILLLLTFACLSVVVGVASEFTPMIAGSVLLSLLVALVPASQGRPRLQVYLAAFAAGVLVDLGLALNRFDVHGEFTNFGWSQFATVVLGAALARLVSEGFRRIGRPRGSAHRPQSLS